MSWCAVDDACDDCLRSVKTVDGADPPTSASLVDSSPWSTCRHRPDYPSGLTNLADPPPVLFGLGERKGLKALCGDTPRITLIGARRASKSGLVIAEGLGRELSAAGVSVISGMARGIDSAAHRGALAGGSATIAVLGSGADICYPQSGRLLYGEILAQGLILSELPPGSQPRNWTFPSRNRLMAALGQMTVVVEAQRSSGSLITASMAADIGREIGAVPGPILSPNSDGVNSLLRDGAHVIRHVEDVLDSLPVACRPSDKSAERTLRLPEGLASLLLTVSLHPGTVDEISAAHPDSAHGIAGALARLELAGYVRRDASGCFVRTALAPPAHGL